MNFRKLTTLIMAAGALVAWATQPQQLTIEPGAHHPVLSPDGSVLLYSTVDHTGLKALNLTDGSVTTIDEAPAAGFQPMFSTDGKTVYYRTASIVDGCSIATSARTTSPLPTPSSWPSPTVATTI